MLPLPPRGFNERGETEQIIIVLELTKKKQSGQETALSPTFLTDADIDGADAGADGNVNESASNASDMMASMRFRTGIVAGVGAKRGPIT